jgi:hypothetical protein
VIGCKLRITVPQGGHVTTESGGYDCAEGDVCTIDVVDIFFDEKFTAVPKSCYGFKSWVQYDSVFSFCGNSNGACLLNTKLFGSFEALMAILESDQMFFLQPEFEAETGCLEEAVESTFAGDDSFRQDLRSEFNNCIVDGLFRNTFSLVSNGETGELRLNYQVGGSAIHGNCSVTGYSDSETMQFAIDKESGTFSTVFRATSSVTSFVGQFRDGTVYLNYEIEFLAPNIIAPNVQRQIELSKLEDG